MAMSEKRILEWKDRLDHADRVWAHHGLFRETECDDILEILKGYRGDQWKFSWGGIPQEELIVVNMIFSVTNTLKSTLNARNPIVDVTAQNPESFQNARVQEVLLNFLVRSRRLRMKREFNRALLDALLLPAGIIRHGYTPTRETMTDDGRRISTYDPARPDFPWIRRKPMWDVRIDPMAETFDSDGDARWVMFRDLMFMEDIEENPAMTKPRDLQATVSIDKLSLFPDEMESRQNPDHHRLVEVWTVYEKMERTWFQMSPGSSKLLRQPKDWPLPWDSLPYDFLGFNDQVDDPFPVPFPKIYQQQQMERNKIRTLAAEIVKRMRRVIFVNDEALKEGESEKLTGDPELAEFFLTNGADPNTILKEVQVSGGGIQELLLYDAKIEDDVRKTVGVGEMNRAQRINVETATEAGAVDRGQQMQTGRNQSPFEDFVGDVIAKFARALQETVTDEFVIPIVGERDAAMLFAEAAGGSPFLRVGPEQVKGEFLYEIRPGSMIPRDPNSEVKKQMAWMQATAADKDLVNIPQSMLDLAKAFDKDPSRALQNPQQIQATDAVGTARGTPPAQRDNGSAVNPNLAALLNETGRQQ